MSIPPELKASVIARYCDDKAPSLREIAREFGIHHDQVGGIVRRSGVSNRGSPVGGAPAARVAKPARITGPVTLPPLGLALVVSDDLKPLPVRREAPIPCCWPIGEPGTKQFRFCDGVTAPGKPYCEVHAARAYGKVRDRREDVVHG